MAPRSLARLAGDYMTYLQLLAQAPPEAMPPAASVRGQLMTLLEPVSKAAETDGIPSDELEEARFALVAWADETLLRRDWAGRPEWQQQPLQMQLYRTSHAGNEFFDHLARLRPEQNSAREVYFYALVGGFEGQYAGQEAERRALIAHQYEMLRAGGRALDLSGQSPLTAPAYELEASLGAGGGLGVLGWLGIGVLGLIVIYGILWIVLYFTVGDVPLPRRV